MASHAGLVDAYPPFRAPFALACRWAVVDFAVRCFKAFRKDANDADRVLVPLDHLPFYYNRYYKKALLLMGSRIHARP